MERDFFVWRNESYLPNANAFETSRALRRVRQTDQLLGSGCPLRPDPLLPDPFLFSARVSPTGGNASRRLSSLSFHRTSLHQPFGPPPPVFQNTRLVPIHVIPRPTPRQPGPTSPQANWLRPAITSATLTRVPTEALLVDSMIHSFPMPSRHSPPMRLPQTSASRYSKPISAKRFFCRAWRVR